jgi:8-oxo-dGTP diphosphatase
MMADINKISGIVIRNKTLLVTREKGEKAFFALGGRMEPGETELECLQRELSEEINCKPVNPKQFRAFEGPAHNSKQSIRISCYFCEIEGEMKPGYEIEEIAWIDRDYKEKGITLGHMLDAEIVPELIRKGLL